MRHDHGGQYMSRDFQRVITWLGAKSSPAFIRAPESSGCAERSIRTLKENLFWSGPSATSRYSPRADRLQAGL
jgi:putative transposase